MGTKAVKYYVDMERDDRGYRWVLLEPCEMNGISLRTGHSRDYISLLNSLFTILQEAMDEHAVIHFLRAHPPGYTNDSVKGYLSVVSSSVGRRKHPLPSTELANREGGYNYVSHVFIDYPELSPITLRDMIEVLDPVEHSAFWNRLVIRTVASLTGDDMDQTHKIMENSSKVKEVLKLTEGEEQWRGEFIPKDTVVIATDGSSSLKSSSFSYVTSLGDFYVCEDKKLRNNSTQAELRALRRAKKDCEKYVAQGFKVILLSDNTSAVNTVKKEALPKGMEGKVEIRWVKGHSGHPLNHAADRIANIARTGKDSKQARQQRMAQLVRQSVREWSKHVEGQELLCAAPSAKLSLGEQWMKQVSLGILWGMAPAAG